MRILVFLVSVATLLSPSSLRAVDAVIPVPADKTNPAYIGYLLYQKLKHDHPDAPLLPDHDLTPHTIDIEIDTGMGAGYAYLDLSMPLSVWKKLNQKDKTALVAFIRSEIKDAREHPDKYAYLVFPESPVYPAAMNSIRQMGDDAWQIKVGHLDDEGYLNEDETALNGADYKGGLSGVPAITNADPASDPVYNSRLNGAVSQVVEYHKQHLNDPDSVQYSNWTSVVKTGIGYRVSVTFRAKNESGGYAIHDQTFDFDKSGNVTKVVNNTP